MPDGTYLGELEFTDENPGFNDGGFVPYRNSIYCGEGMLRQELAIRDFATKPEFRAVIPGCELLGALRNNEQLPQVTADITLSEVMGSVIVSGEVIKAAIEYYYKRRAPDDYLDHVYQFGASRDENGLPFKTINSGNRTFAASAFNDEFGITLPGQVVLVVDNELELGAVI